jgi:hypothetical protein
VKKNQIAAIFLIASMANPTQATWNGFREFVQKNKAAIKYIAATSAAAIISGLAAYKCHQKAVSVLQEEEDIMNHALDWQLPRRNPADIPANFPPRVFGSLDWAALSDVCIFISLMAGLSAGVTAYDELYNTYDQVYKK